jgi:tetratricopeptide (TPR) repeat protein
MLSVSCWPLCEDLAASNHLSFSSNQPMSFPQIVGLEVHEPIGTGCAGAVFRAMGPGGKPWALKILNSMAINRKGLETTLVGLQAMPPHRGVLPVLGFDLMHSPYYVATPLVGMTVSEAGGARAFQTPTLESVCGRISAEQAWAYIYDMSDALAHMHRHGVQHGNLTTGNVLVNTDAEGGTRIIDAGQGYVGGVHRINLRHHYLFLAPDQVENPEGFIAGYGYSWDVYSFGVLAYRLLTGQYPRATSAWDEELSREQIQAAKGLGYDINGQHLVRAVRAQPHITWPTPPAHKWEERRRKVVEIALEIDSGSRWVDMRDVAREFENLEADFLLEEARAATDAERECQRRKVVGLQAVRSGLAVVLTAVGAYAAFNQLRINGANTQIESLHVDYQKEIQTRDGRITDLTSTLSRTEREKSAMDSNLQQSQTMVDQLLTQLLQLPTGDNLEVAFTRDQLLQAGDYLRASLGRMEGQQGMGPERARALGNIGMIYLKQRRTADAQIYLDKARQELHGLLTKDPKGPHSSMQHQCLGRYSLLLAHITTARGDGESSMRLLKEATENLELGLEGVNQNRQVRLESALAWLDFGARKRLEGDGQGAAEALAKVKSTLGEGTHESPLEPREQFVLARGELEEGLALKDAGKPEDAIETLITAIQKMGTLVSGSAPNNQEQALLLAQAYTELAELIAKHVTLKEAAEAYDEAGKVLIELIRLEPDWVEAKYLMARTNGAQAGLSRDEGRPGEALSLKKRAIEQVGEIVDADPDNPRFLFLKARLKGELAEIMSDLGQTASAVPIAQDAVTTLETMLQKFSSERIAAERKDWEVQMAVLYGVLGQSLEASKKRDDAKRLFQLAEKQWLRLEALDKDNPVVKQGLDWAKNRLAKLN